MFCITSVFDKYKNKKNLIWFCEPSSDFYVEVVDLGNLYRSTMRFDLACKINNITNLHYESDFPLNQLECFDFRLCNALKYLLIYNREFIMNVDSELSDLLRFSSDVIVVEIENYLNEYIDDSYLLLRMLNDCNSYDIERMFVGNFKVCFIGHFDGDENFNCAIFMDIRVKDLKEFQKLMSKYALVRWG